MASSWCWSGATWHSQCSSTPYGGTCSVSCEPPPSCLVCSRLAGFDASHSFPGSEYCREAEYTHPSELSADCVMLVFHAGMGVYGQRLDLGWRLQGVTPFESGLVLLPRYPRVHACWLARNHALSQVPTRGRPAFLRAVCQPAAGQVHQVHLSRTPACVRQPEGRVAAGTACWWRGPRATTRRRWPPCTHRSKQNTRGSHGAATNSPPTLQTGATPRMGRAMRGRLATRRVLTVSSMQYSASRPQSLSRASCTAAAPDSILVGIWIA